MFEALNILADSDSIEWVCFFPMYVMLMWWFFFNDDDE